MPAAKNVCLYCQKTIKSGRSDKLFCDSGCKDAYNNDIKIQEHSEIRKVMTILKRNRRVLKKMYQPKQRDKLFSRESFIKAGFEFGFQTHTVITKNKANEIIFCFDYGYREASKGSYQVYASFMKVQVKEGQVFEL